MGQLSRTLTQSPMGQCVGWALLFRLRINRVATSELPEDF